MATAWRRNPSPSISTKCWKIFNLGSQDYLIRVLTTEDSYEVQMFEFQNYSMWTESLSGSTLVSKLKVNLSCNSYFEVQSALFTSVVSLF